MRIVFNPEMNALKMFTDINVERCTDPKGFNMPLDPGYFLLCLQQELGEVSAIFTKLKRGYNKREQKKMYLKAKKEWESNNPEDKPYPFPDGSHLEPRWRADLYSKIGPEFGDILSYLVLAARSLGVKDILTESIHKFNSVSKDMESPYEILITESTDSTLTHPGY